MPSLLISLFLSKTKLEIIGAMVEALVDWKEGMKIIDERK